MRFIASLALAVLATGCATPRTASAPGAPVTVGIIAINDFHGALEPPKQSVSVPDGKGGVTDLPAGGAAWLASAIDSVRAKYPNHVTVSAGDMIGGSQFASSMFVDEPAIGVMNRIGLDFNAVGNHEFDSGTAELRRKQTGGCEKFTKREPCAVEPFKGASFGFLAANVKLKDGSGTLFPSTALRSFGEGKRKVTVGFIGMTLEGTGPLVAASGIGDVTFAGEAETANALVPALKAQGADAIVLLIHQGARKPSPPDPDGCEGIITGPIRRVLAALDPRVDVVVSGHTHQAYVCDWGEVDPKRPFLLTSAGMWGELVSDITLEIDPASDRVVAKHADNIVVQSQGYIGGHGPVVIDPSFPHFAPRRDVADYVARYVEAAAGFARRRVGSLGGAAEKTVGADSASGGPLGNLVADAQLAATQDAGARIAFMNPFGLRASLTPAANGSVTFGDIYAVQPFNNQLVTLNLTGAQIKAALEQGFDDDGPEQVLTPSRGFSFTYDRSRVIGSRIVAISLDGTPLDPAATYRVTMSSFLADGGDSFTVFSQGSDRTIGSADIDALESWLKAGPARVPPSEDREIDARPELNPAAKVR